MSRLVPLLKKAFLASGLDHILRHIYTGRGMILCFHQVYPSGYRPELQKKTANSHFTPEGLETVLGWFSEHGYAFAAMDDVPGLLAGNSRKFVALTFDDGYRDNMLYALPVLRKFNAPMTMYASAGNPDDNLMLWIFLLDRFVAERTEIVIGDPMISTISCATPQEKKRAFSTILDYSLSSPAGQLQALKDLLDGYRPGVGLYRDLLLTDDELREFDRDPLVTIGSHGMTHSKLVALPEDAAFCELTESKCRLESILGHEVRHYAYPYGGPGYAGDREFLLAARAGYATAVTTRHAHLFDAHAEHLTALPRIIIGPAVMDNPELIRLYANGFTALKANRGRRIVVA